ncbi:MAG: hypothetical protein WAW23_03555 [Candidatus Methanoperedens sp.]
MAKGEKVPDEIMKRLKIWNLVSGILRYLHISLGIIAIVSSVTVASRLYLPDTNLMAWIAWLAAISSALLTSMNLGTKSNQVRTGTILKSSDLLIFPMKKRMIW